MKKNQISEMTDRELQEGMYQNIRTITAKARSTNGWITFIGVLVIIQVIGMIIVANSLGANIY